MVVGEANGAERSVDTVKAVHFALTLLGIQMGMQLALEEEGRSQ